MHKFVQFPTHAGQFRFNTAYIKFYQPDGKGRTMITLDDELQIRFRVDLPIEKVDEIISGKNEHGSSEVASRPTLSAHKSI